MGDRILKLYVWEDVLLAQSHGMLIAVAYDIKEAKRILLETDDSLSFFPQDLAKQPKVILLTKNTKPIAFAVHGDG